MLQIIFFLEIKKRRLVYITDDNNNLNLIYEFREYDSTKTDLATQLKLYISKEMNNKFYLRFSFESIRQKINMTNQLLACKACSERKIQFQEKFPMRSFV